MSDHTGHSQATKVIETIDIVVEISKHVSLKPSKHEFIGLCPFHNEETPSFYVNPAKQLFYCFGCQAGGNVINFKARIENLTNRDALESLAKEYRIQLSFSNPQQSNQLTLLRDAARYYQSQLKHHAKVLSYLTERGLTQETIETFQVGYAPKGWHNLAKGVSGFNKEHACSTGLLIENDKHQYDRFRDRVIFPIISHQNHIVGFGGRAIGDEKPKYINSSESPIYHKSNILYGLYQAIQHKHKQLIVVEGYMDVITMHQFGFTQAIASLGTAFTPGHFHLACRYAEEIVFCFDGDTAGKNAALKAFHTAAPLLRDQIKCSFLFLPDKQDPDSLLHTHGREHFANMLLSAMPFSTFLFEHLTQALPDKTLEDKAARIKLIQVVLNKMPDSIFKNLMTDQLPVQDPKKRYIQPTSKSISTASHEHRLIALLFAHPELINNNLDLLKQYAIYLPELCQLAIEVLLKKTTYSLALFMQTHIPQKQHELILCIHCNQLEQDSQEIADLISYFQIQQLEKRIQQSISTIGRKTETEDGSLNIQKLIEMKQFLKKKKIKLVTSGVS